MFIVINSWNAWFSQVHKVELPALHFLMGKYSVRDAYSHQSGGFIFGGIYPGAWQAMQHVPPGERLWSTTVVTYCMAPNCQIESVISFKLSSQLNTVLNGTPLQAKEILEKEGLNYFLFTSEFPLLDVLPFSKLFNPKNIEKYFSIKWTDGQTYLLTWRQANDTQIMNKNFMKVYLARLNEKEDPWFKFSKAVPVLNKFMREYYNSNHPWHPKIFPWLIK